MKIWVVEGYGGSYEDAREWQLKAFFSKEKAEAYAVRLRDGKLVDHAYQDNYKYIGEQPRYNVFPLPIGDKPKVRP